MGFFTTSSRASARGRSEVRAEPSQPGPVPARFEATGDALASDPALGGPGTGVAVLDACEYVGLELGRDGVPLEDADFDASRS